MRKKKSITFIVMLLIMLFASVPKSVAILEEQVVVLFDEAHAQNLTYTLGNFTKAIDALNETVLEYRPGRYAKYIVRLLPSNSTFNSSTLEGIDILIIGNPGRNASFNENELDTIKTFVENGGGLFLMCDPQLNETVYGENGNPTELNKILTKLNISSVLFSHNNSFGDAIFDENHSVIRRPYFVYVNSTEFNNETRISDNIQRVLVFSSSLIVKDNKYIVATGDNESYAMTPNGNFTYQTGTKPPWLVAYENNGFRIVLCGSTIMFSDLNVKRLDIPWIDAENNKILWYNIIKWLTPTPNPVDVSNYFLLAGGIILLLGVASFLTYKLLKARK